MNTLLRTLPLFALIALMTSCAGTQNTSYYDDVYYSPKDETVATTDAYIDIDDREQASGAEDYPKGRQVEEYYDPEAKSRGYDSDLDYDDYRERYNDDEYYYSTRVRRFHRPAYSFGYYDPFYSNSNYYSYDPYFWSPRVVRPYYYSPGWGFNWNSQFGWTGSYTSGWYNPYPFSGFYGNYGGFGGYGGYGYNPYSYYGNSFCPQYGAGGNGYNDFYSNATPVFNGQYNSLRSYSSSSSTHLGKMLPPSKPMYELEENTRPAMNTRPAVRPEHDYVRPSQSTRPAENSPSETRPASTRPSEVERPRETTRPSEDYRPSETRPSDTTRPREDYRPSETRPSETTRPRQPSPTPPQARPQERPRENRSVTPPSNNRRNSSATPSRSTTPTRTRDKGNGSGGRRN